MKRPIAILMMLFLGIATIMAQPELPRKSPKASVSYTVGLTTVEINYCSPAANDRELWGEVVPYDEIWRAGANEATTISFSSDAMVEGKKLAAGTYSFFVIPREGESAKWTLIFNTVADQWGAYRYDESKDALRVDIEPRFTKVQQDRLTFSVHDQSIDKGYIKLAWGKARVYARFLVDVLEPALANVDKALEEAEPGTEWEIYARGASFLLDNDFETRQAMEWADKSTSQFSHSWNWWIKAKAQAKSGDYTGAIESAEKSAEVGMSSDEDKFYENNRKEIQSTVNEWKEHTGG